MKILNQGNKKILLDYKFYYMGPSPKVTFSLTPAIWLGIGYSHQFHTFQIFLPILVISINTLKKVEEAKWFNFENLFRG